MGETPAVVAGTLGYRRGLAVGIALGIVAAACSGAGHLRVERPSATSSTVATDATATASAPPAASSPAPSPPALSPSAVSEPSRHAADPPGVSADQRAVLATHRAFWDAYVPPDQVIMRPRWDELDRYAVSSVVAMYREQFRRDTERDGGLQLQLDLTFLLSTVRVDGTTATLAGCLRQVGTINRRSTGDELGRDDSTLAYAAALERGGPTGWRFTNIEVAEPCPTY